MSQQQYQAVEQPRRAALVPADKPCWHAVVRLSMTQYVCILRQFQQADADRNGSINRVEFRSALGLLSEQSKLPAEVLRFSSTFSSTNPSQPPPSAPVSFELQPLCDIFSDLLFDAFDRAPSDGLISFQEYLIVMAVNLLGTPLERLHVGFSLIDRDGDGWASRDDLSVLFLSIFGLLQTLGVRTVPDPVAHVRQLVDFLFDRLDASRTGARFSRQDYLAQAPSLVIHLRTLGLSHHQQEPTFSNHRPSSFSSSLYDSNFSHSSSSSSSSSFTSSSSFSSHASYADVNTLQPAVPDTVVLGHPHFHTVLNMMFGIGIALGREAQTAAFLGEAPQQSDFSYRYQFAINGGVEFVDIAPKIFRLLRARAGVSDAEYLGALGVEQMLGNCLLGHFSTLSMRLSDGKSGSWFFTTHDNRLFVKTISAAEKRCLERHLPRLFAHMAAHPATLLNHLYGFYEVAGACFVVMGNVFHAALRNGFSLATVYDLKGSTHGRTNATGKGPRKDLDFIGERGRVALAEAPRAELMRQLRHDAQFLEAIGVIDYSLLFGVATRAKPGGVQGEKEVRYVFGIIDILTEFGNLKKGGEFLLRSLINGKDANFSCRPPNEYAVRFVSFIETSFVSSL